MGEMKPTPGEWFCGDWIPAEHNTAGWVEVWTVDAEGNRSLPFVSCKHFDAGDNARLIAEAGTVFHNTGLTPRQLVAQRDELLAMLKLAEAGLADIGDADREPGDDLAWCERRAAEPLPAIRAALAKCEGVKACPSA